MIVRFICWLLIIVILYVFFKLVVGCFGFNLKVYVNDSWYCKNLYYYVGVIDNFNLLLVIKYIWIFYCVLIVNYGLKFYFGNIVIVIFILGKEIY